MSSTNAPEYRGAPAHSESERELRQVFMEAKALSADVGTALLGWKDPGPDDSFPANTLRKLEMAARIHFASGCSLIFEAWLAYGADTHVRALLDIYAHVAWILDMGGLGAPLTPAGRARCFELGMAQQLEAEVALIEDIATRSGQVVASTRVPAAAAIGQQFKDLHRPDACECGGRGRGSWQVRRTLQALAEADASTRLRGAEPLYALWKYTSRVIHHAGFERMMRSDGSRTWIGPAEDWQRIQTFIWLIQLYGTILGWTAEIYSRDVAEDLVKRLGALTGRAALLEVAQANPEIFIMAADREDAQAPQSPANDGR